VSVLDERPPHVCQQVNAVHPLQSAAAADCSALNHAPVPLLFPSGASAYMIQLFSKSGIEINYVSALLWNWQPYTDTQAQLAFTRLGILKCSTVSGSA